LPHNIGLLALTTGGTSSVIAAVTWAAEQAPDPGSIAPYVGGGAGVIAVGALAEVTRRLMTGGLIARQTRDIEQELGAAITAAGQREARLMELIVEERADRQRLHRENADALERLERLIRDNTDRVEARIDRQGKA
jgi:hypothetical protein